MEKENTFLTIKDVANLLCISIATVNNMQRDKLIPPADYLISGAKKRLWLKSSLLNWLDETCQNPKLQKFKLEAKQ